MNPAFLLAAGVLATAVSFTVTTATAQARTEATAKVDFTNGEIRKVDLQEKKFTLKHDEIKNLRMPPMTMNYEVRDAAWLTAFKAGDKVRFKVVQEGNRYIVTEIQSRP